MGEFSFDRKLLVHCVSDLPRGNAGAPLRFMPATLLGLMLASVKGRGDLGTSPDAMLGSRELFSEVCSVFRCSDASVGLRKDGLLTGALLLAAEEGVLR